MLVGRHLFNSFFTEGGGGDSRKQDVNHTDKDDLSLFYGFQLNICYGDYGDYILSDNIQNIYGCKLLIA